MTRALCAAALLLAACEGWGIDPDLERMIDQARVDPYEASPYFADGRAMRAPPAGTVPLERPIGVPALTEGRRHGAYVDSVPVPVTPELLAAGRKRFEIVCAACHGLLGDGRSKVAENMLLRPPRNLHDAAVRAYPAGRIFEVIDKGYGLMPSLAYQLSIEDRWAVVAYVRALQLSQAVRLDDLPPAVRQEAEQALEAGK